MYCMNECNTDNVLLLSVIGIVWLYGWNDLLLCIGNSLLRSRVM